MAEQELSGAPNLEAITIDSESALFLLQMGARHVAFFQGIFESYEGVGLVRTLHNQRSILAVVCSPDMAADCRRLLADIWPITSWYPALFESPAERQHYIEFFR